MSSVTKRIKEIKQPYGGYLSPSKFLIQDGWNDGIILNDEENVYPSLVGLTVDYLTRYLVGIEDPLVKILARKNRCSERRCSAINAFLYL